jgi:hypothetical protein
MKRWRKTTGKKGNATLIAKLEVTPDESEEACWFEDKQER